MMQTLEPASVVSTPDLSRICLTLQSQLADLVLHDYQVEADCLGIEVTATFKANPLLPGVILRDAGQFLGMISRRRFLESMSRPYGLEIFSKRSLRVMYEFGRIPVLVLPGNTPIVAAVQQSLERPPEVLYEPIVVQLNATEYRLLDIHHLFLAQSRIHQLTTQLLDEQSQAKLLQTEKMASLGEMVAGVAHEIMNPVNFIWGNLEYLSNYSQDLLQLLQVYDTELAQPSTQVEQFKQAIEFEFVVNDLPQVINSMKMGAERLKKIISALRNFSHLDEGSKRPVDLQECLDNTLLILSNRLKHHIQVTKNYQAIPSISGYAGQLSQVFVNLIGNAIDALTDLIEQPPHDSWQAEITITTQSCSHPTDRHADGWVAIQISDNGSGIPAAVQERIFDTFFTTKPVGQGTGLGLAISRQIIIEKHAGQISFWTQPGKGTTFEVLLPIHHP
ncbi:sensor histidine kinase [Pantanalinema rosaneae CENA516]|uniref:sensor histidine kinase n=1 Tax=Pantanalinema rosaneae TaxID=1620701 RepID=UPI003D6F558F